MKRPRYLRWEATSPPPKHPYRDTAILYAVFAALIVVTAWASGGSPVEGVAYAAIFYVVACGWSWWRWRVRLSHQGSNR